MKTKEEIIREEIRSLRELMFKLVEWGVSILVGLQAALFFVRKEIVKSLLERELSPGMSSKQAVESLVQSHKLAEGGRLPWDRYLFGTVLLFAVACIFTALTLYLSSHYRFYRRELTNNLESGVKPPPELRRTPRRLLVLMYMFFPVFDVLARWLLQYV
jgi:hypothetical protein